MLDVFRKNVATGEISRVSTSGDAAPVQGDRASGEVKINQDGQFVVFSSSGDQPCERGSNNASDIFRKDMTSGAMVRVSTAADGAQATGSSFRPQISADGGLVVFDSAANNLVAGDTNGRTDIFAKDVASGAITLVSIAGGVGAPIANGNSIEAELTPDGRFWCSQHSTNLVGGDTNGIETFSGRT